METNKIRISKSIYINTTYLIFICISSTYASATRYFSKTIQHLPKEQQVIFYIILVIGVVITILYSIFAVPRYKHVIKKDPIKPNDEDIPIEGPTKKCDYCSKLNRMDAKKCQCGYYFDKILYEKIQNEQNRIAYNEGTIDQLNKLPSYLRVLAFIGRKLSNFNLKIIITAIICLFAYLLIRFIVS